MATSHLPMIDKQPNTFAFSGQISRLESRQGQAPAGMQQIAPLPHPVLPDYALLSTIEQQFQDSITSIENNLNRNLKALKKSFKEQINKYHEVSQ